MEISFLTLDDQSAEKPRRKLRAATTSLIFIIAAGCGDARPERVPTFPVKGLISFRGQPVNGAFVSLHPQAGPATSAPAPRASVAADGTFNLSTYDGQDGAPEGDYVLTVKWYRPVKKNGEFVSGPNALPRKYERPETSDIQIQIAAQNNNQLTPIFLK